MRNRLVLAVATLSAAVSCSEPEPGTSGDVSSTGTEAVGVPTIDPTMGAVPASGGPSAPPASTTSSAAPATSPSATGSLTASAPGASAPGASSSGAGSSGAGGASGMQSSSASSGGAPDFGEAGSSGVGGASGNGQGGASGSHTAGAPGVGGSAQTGGAGSGGAASGEAGAGGAGSNPDTDLTALAADFHQLRLECPCIDADHFGPDKQDNCDVTPEVDRQTHTLTFGGDPDVIYDVRLHVRGNTEPNTYVDGTLEGERFYIGGRTSTAGYTAYMLTVEDPNEVYFFNYNPTTGHIHFLLDYEVVIPMRGGTTVHFEVNGGDSVPDGHGVSNREELVVPGIPPAPEPFNGQLVQFDVVSVEPQADNP